MTSGSAGAKEAFVKVVARIRPRLAKEAQLVEGIDATPDRRSVVLASKQGDRKTFTFDQVFDARQARGSQAALFDSFGVELVNLSLLGYNVCVFAYGHTGTGKSYTMLGDGSVAGTCGSGLHAGLIPRCLREVFEAQKQDPQTARHRYSCEYYEVYNEQIKDLLQPLGAQRTRKVHVHPKHGVRVENLTMAVVRSTEDALNLVDFGHQMRAVAATTMNARSSRSHAIFTFRHERLSQLGDAEGQGYQSTMTFVDLAGREDPTASKNRALQFREMCAINTSLFHLAHMISKLSSAHSGDGSRAERHSIKNFRNSKLTLLLSPALVGNTRTALVATLAPLQTYFDDSLSTCSFAASVKKVRTRPAVNNKSTSALVSELEAEVLQLQRELAASKTHNSEKEQELNAAQALIASYEKSWEETVAKSEEVSMNRSRSLTTFGLTCPTARAESTRQETVLVPFFTKLCDDPTLQGRCNYFLQKGPLRIGSDDATCDIVLKGLGISFQMCEVVWVQSRTVQIKLLNAEAGGDGIPRVLVAGRPLSLTKPIGVIHHGDCIYLGYSHAFRLVAPSAEELSRCPALDALHLARETIRSLDVASAVAEVTDEAGAQFKQLVPFIHHLSSRSSEEVVRRFLDSLHRVCPLVDEANLITREVFGDRSIRFQLHALTNIFDFAKDIPELVVCALRSRPKEPPEKLRVAVVAGLDVEKIEQNASTPGSRDSSLLLESARTPMVAELGLADHMTIGGEEPLQYVWSLEKFLCRLRAMREAYQDSLEAGTGFSALLKRLSNRPFEDPWSELPLSDAQLLGESSMLSKRCTLTEWMAHQPASVTSSVCSPQHGTPNDSIDHTPSCTPSAGGSLAVPVLDRSFGSGVQAVEDGADLARGVNLVRASLASSSSQGLLGAPVQAARSVRQEAKATKDIPIAQVASSSSFAPPRRVPELALPGSRQNNAQGCPLSSTPASSSRSGPLVSAVQQEGLSSTNALQRHRSAFEDRRSTMSTPPKTRDALTVVRNVATPNRHRAKDICASPATASTPRSSFDTGRRASASTLKPSTPRVAKEMGTRRAPSPISARSRLRGTASAISATGTMGATASTAGASPRMAPQRRDTSPPVRSASSQKLKPSGTPNRSPLPPRKPHAPSTPGGARAPVRSTGRSDTASRRHESPFAAAIDSQVKWMFSEITRMQAMLTRVRGDQPGVVKEDQVADTCTNQFSLSLSSSSTRATGACCEDLTPPSTARRPHGCSACDAAEFNGQSFAERLADMKRQAETANSEAAVDVMRRVNAFHAELVQTVKGKLKNKLQTLGSGTSTTSTRSGSAPSSPRDPFVVYRPTAPQPTSVRGEPSSPLVSPRVTNKPPIRPQQQQGDCIVASPYPRRRSMPGTTTAEECARPVGVLPLAAPISSPVTTTRVIAHHSPAGASSQGLLSSTGSNAVPPLPLLGSPSGMLAPVAHGGDHLSGGRLVRTPSSETPLWGRQVIAVPKVRWDVYYEI